MGLNAVFYVRQGVKYDGGLAEAMCYGINRCGDIAEIRYQMPTDVERNVEIAIAVGARRDSRELCLARSDSGLTTVIIDKGYTRMSGGTLGTLYWKVTVNALQPTGYFQVPQRDNERWNPICTPLCDLKPRGKSIIFAGSSQKYCDWHNLGDKIEYASRVIDAIKVQTNRPVIFRTKRSSKLIEQNPPGTTHSPSRAYLKESLADILPRAHCLVTFGSNAAVEAVLHGVPVVVLGDGIAKPIATTNIRQIQNPFCPTMKAVYRWACNLAYCQYSVEEMFTGVAWRYIKEVVNRG